MRDFPEGYAEVEQSQARHSAAHPAGRDCVLQALQACLLRRVEQKEIVTPIRQAKRRNPGQQGEHYADFEAQDNVKDNAELGCHSPSSDK